MRVDDPFFPISSFVVTAADKTLISKTHLAKGFSLPSQLFFNSMLACLDEKVLRESKHIYFNFSSTQLSYKKSFEKAVL